VSNIGVGTKTRRLNKGRSGDTLFQRYDITTALDLAIILSHRLQRRRGSEYWDDKESELDEGVYKKHGGLELNFGSEAKAL
jgi:hypothetical protein